MDLIKKFRKLEDWDSEDELGPTLTATGKFSDHANKSGRVVVPKHVFTLDELEEDPSLLLDLKEDARVECATLGDVTNVVSYDVREFVLTTSIGRSSLVFLQQEPEGIMTVKFRDPISAKACIIVRSFLSTPSSPTHAPKALRKCKAGSSPVVR